MAPPMPRRRNRPKITPLHKRGTSPKGGLETLGSIHQKETNDPVNPTPNSSRADAMPSTQSQLEQLPLEVVNHILTLRDAKSQREIKLTEDLESPPDTDRFAANLFAWTSIRHPFNALAASSRQCREFVESYCEHLVKSCNRFNLPFAQVEGNGNRLDSVYPSLSSIVYRRLWLQTAPRSCLYCGAFMSQYPYPELPVRYRLMLCCRDCFFAQTLDLYEVQHQYHIIDPGILAKYGVRGSSPRYEWILRIDVEALALQLYGTRAFHDTLSQGLEAHCSIPNCGLAANLLTLSRHPPARRLPGNVSPASPRRNRRRGT
ncbi:hypothetical protein DPSP01_002021 [Paraphaeosphaeria sporulosa]